MLYINVTCFCSDLMPFIYCTAVPVYYLQFLFLAFYLSAPATADPAAAPPGEDNEAPPCRSLLRHGTKRGSTEKIDAKKKPKHVF